MKIKIVRKTVQWFVFIGIFLVPFLNIWEIYFIKGTFYSIDAGSLAMADPLAIFQAFLASGTFGYLMLASIVLPVLLMLIFGRVWCSFMCPYYLLTEIIEFIRKRVGIKKPAYSNNKLSKTNILRFGFLIFGIFIMGISGIPLLNLISAPGIISSQALVLVKFQYLTFEALFILFLLILELFFYRFWCRFFCPTGTFLSLIGTNHLMYVKKVTTECSMCKSCINNCPMLINPMKDGKSFACNNCGDCVEVCPDNKIKDTLKMKI